MDIAPGHWAHTLTAWIQRTMASPSAVPAEASGTFNPLCKVLCILQSLYLCSIGPMSVCFLVRDTPHSFKLQSQATLLLDPSSNIGMATAHSTVWDSIPLARTIPGHLLVHGQATTLPQGPQSTASAETHESRAHHVRPGNRSLRGETSVASSLAVTEAIAVACTSTTE